MKTNESKSPVKTRGRKQDNSRTESILKAAIELLLDVGFDKFRVQDVANRAGAGTGAIYRRWPKKEALIADAIRIMPNDKPQITDDPIADLKALISPKCKSAFEKPDLVPGLVSAMRADKGIEEAVKAGYSLDNLNNAIARVVGEDHPNLKLLSELTPAIALLRSSFTPEEIEPDAMTNEILSLILSMAKTSS